jgi:hypothetical protein
MLPNNGSRAIQSQQLPYIVIRRLPIKKTNNPKVRFEVLTAGTIRSSVFKDITQYSSVKFNCCFREIDRLHLHGRVVSEERKQHEEGSICCVFQVGFYLGLLFEPEDRGDMFLRKVKNTSRSRQPVLAPSHIFLVLLFDPEDGGGYFPAKCRFTLTGLHGDMFQISELFRIQIFSWL